MISGQTCDPCSSAAVGVYHACDEIVGTHHRCICTCMAEAKKILRRSGVSTEACTRLPAEDHRHDMTICKRCKAGADKRPGAQTATLHRHCPSIDPHPVATEIERRAALKDRSLARSS